jgi:hypothetical protein
MSNKLAVASLCCLFSLNALADDLRGVPQKLFGIAVGGIYDIESSDTQNPDGVPMKKFTGSYKFLGSGTHYYFEPKIKNKNFPYKENKKKPGDKYFETSYHLYIFPIVPPTITNYEDFKTEKVKWEVASIEWSDEPKTKDEAYYWAIDLCQTFSADISVKPTIQDFAEAKSYECTFASGDREFVVSSFYGKRIKLGFNDKVFKVKNEAVETTMRKIQANEIRPY